MVYDFSGYATRNNIRCSDGRTIMRNAFADNDGMKVPLVYQHDHNTLDNVLGHALLENRDDGVYCYGTFNDTPEGQTAKSLVEHGDITALSIYANHLTQKGGDVIHGSIREVSLVLAGANPGAFIDNVTIQHSDGTSDELDDEAVIYSGETIELAHTDEEDYDDDDDYDYDDDDDYDEDEDDMYDYVDEDDMFEHADGGKTIQQVFDSMSDKQKNAVYALIGAALSGESDMSHADDMDDSYEESGSGEETVEDVFNTLTKEQKDVAYALIGLAVQEQGGRSGNDEDNNAAHSADGGYNMYMNAFEKAGATYDAPVLSHEDQTEFMEGAREFGSFRDFALKHAQDYGIKDIEVLFPDARATTTEPTLYKRDTEWVQVVLSGTRHTPFARIKSTYADLTADEARAKGYTLDRNNNHRKLDEIFRVHKRVTTPQTIYKKQKLDRDDEIDITDFNVVAFMQAEMRVMLNEEIARDILIGDGRSADAEDHVNTDNVRPVVSDDDLYVIHSVGTKDETPTDLVDRIRTSKVGYQGSGMPTLFIAPSTHGQLMVQRDKMGRRLYDTDASLAAAMGVSSIVEVPVLEGFSYTGSDSKEYNVQGIALNLRDYTVGSDKGGELTTFEDFDIDYNQHKYLLETRISGALTLPKSAIVIETPKA